MQAVFYLLRRHARKRILTFHSDAADCPAAGPRIKSRTMQKQLHPGEAAAPGLTLAVANKKEHERDIIEGNWEATQGKLKEQWGKLTDDDLDVIEGKREVLAGKIQERYGVTKAMRPKSM